MPFAFSSHSKERLTALYEPQGMYAPILPNAFEVLSLLVCTAPSFTTWHRKLQTQEPMPWTHSDLCQTGHQVLPTQARGLMAHGTTKT